MKQLLHLWKSSAVFSCGTIRFVNPKNHRILTYLRELDGETVLVVNNLSRTAQAVELSLREFKGAIPIEMFGGNPFPRIGDLPYVLTLGAYHFFWFSLRRL
jgi:maltose alpha-D-glucosyltransferase/alpha-amylase